MKKYKNHVEPFAVGFLNAEHDDWGYKIANGMLEHAKYAPIDIRPGQVFAGFYDKNTPIGVTYDYGYALQVNVEKLQMQIEKFPEYAEELTDIKEKMVGKGSNDIAHSFGTEKEKKLWEMRVCWGGTIIKTWQGHGNPDFGYIVHHGTDGVREKINKYRKLNPGKAVFYDSLLLTLEALEIQAMRYQELALKMAGESEGQDKERLLRIVKAFNIVPRKPAQSLFEAFQSFWLSFCMDDVDSPGPFDQYMIDYYRTADEEERTYCLEGLWQLFQDTRTWNMCISGSDENWKDMTNELSYDILKVARKFKYDTPNLTMRVHRNTPEELWKSAAETMATGIGMPALYNDECVCPALEAIGIPPVDSHNYCMNGCNQIDIFGKSHMGLEDGEVCLAKCLELALYNGVCGYSWEKIGIETGDPRSFETFEQFMDAYKKQVEYVTDAAVTMAYKSQEIAAKYAPNPWRSNLVEGCIEKGLDYKNKGPIYGHAQILAEGIADAVDSLAAIKHFIFDKKKYSFAQLIDALKKNYEGYDELYHDFNTYDKFGNDIPYVDDIYKEVVEHFYGYLLDKETYRGGVFGGGCSTFQRTAAYAEKLGAMPNGKKRESLILADSIGAVPGCDKNGPTALINSVTIADQLLAKSGNVLQMKFNKDIFNTPTGLNAFISLAKTYFKKGGQQMQINVVSLEELLDAQIHPEAHENLVVRVGGFSAYFTRLSPGLQENIIKRTEQVM